MQIKKDTLTLRFLYKTAAGRLLLKGLVQPCISKAAGNLLSSPVSRFIIPHYKKAHGISTEDCVTQDFRSFNDFFSRKRKKDIIDEDPSVLISPCDGLLSVFSVDDARTFRIKDVDYELGQLLRDDALAQQYSGGKCLIFRLTPQHYHRYCFATGGIVEKTKAIGGILHCVRPVAYTIRPVFIENSREYTIISTQNFGKIVQMEIGALMVGRIHNLDVGPEIVKGSEKGYFEFGGSTIIVLVEKDRLDIKEEFIGNTERGIETDVRLGQYIGRAEEKAGQENGH